MGKYATHCFAIVLPEKCLVQVGKQLLLNVEQHLKVKGGQIRHKK